MRQECRTNVTRGWGVVHGITDTSKYKQTRRAYLCASLCSPPPICMWSIVAWKSDRELNINGLYWMIFNIYSYDE